MDHNWPAQSYIYGTWGYALSQARARANYHNQKMYLYQELLGYKKVWVVSWDPKKK